MDRPRASHGLLDRGGECAAIDSLLAAAVRGVPGILVFQEFLGTGKTSLLTYAAAHATAMTVVQADGLVAERAVEFGWLHRLILPVTGVLKQLPVGQRRALQVAVGLRVGRQPSRLAIQAGALGLLTRLASVHPLLLLVDDADLLDEPSAEALAFAGRRLDAQRLAIVLALDDAARDGHAFADFPRTRIGPLSDGSAAILLSDSFPGELDRGVRDRVIRAASGNPLALTEITDALTVAQRAGDEPLPEILPVGGRLTQLAAMALDRLPPGARVALLLSTAQPQSDAATLRRALTVLAVSPHDVRSARAERVLSRPGELGFRHPLAALAAASVIGPAAMRRGHTALRQSLDPAADPVARALHGAAASEAADEALAAELVSASRFLATRGDPVGAGALLALAALRTPESSPARTDRLFAALEVCVRLGAPAQLASLTGELATMRLDETASARLLRLRGLAELGRDRATDAALMLGAAADSLERVGAADIVPARLEALQAAFAAGAAAGAAGVRAAEAARRAARAEPRRTLAGVILDAFGGRVLCPEGPVAQAMREVLDALRGVADPRWLVFGSWAAADVWDGQAGREIALRWVELAEASGSRVELGRALENRALHDTLSGRLGAAAASLHRAEESFGAPGAQWQAGRTAGGRLLVEAWGGHEHIARRLAATVLRGAMDHGHGVAEAGAWYALAVLENGLGNYEAAVLAARQAAEHDSVLFGTLALPELVEAGMRTGRDEAARWAAERIAARATAGGAAEGLGMVALSRGLLERGAAADGLYQQAIGELARGTARPALARAHLLYGEWLRRQRRIRQARTRLGHARELLLAIGASAFAERALGELRATGEQTQDGDSSPLSELTGQERRIAERVVAGASNPEVARELYISRRTVEYHLHKVFRKLEVSSRIELARLLLGERPSPEDS